MRLPRHTLGWFFQAKNINANFYISRRRLFFLGITVLDKDFHSYLVLRSGMRDY